MSQRHAPRHRHGHHRRPHPRHPRQYDVYRARKQGQTLVMLAVAGLGLALLAGFVVLVEGGRDGFRHGGGALLDEPWK